MTPINSSAGKHSRAMFDLSSSLPPGRRAGRKAGTMKTTTQTNRLYGELAGLLKKHHGKNRNDVLVTDYAAIPNLEVGASVCTGRSGLGTFRGVHVYWHATGGAGIEPVVFHIEPWLPSRQLMARRRR